MLKPAPHHLRATALLLILGFATSLSLAYAAAIFSPVMPPARGPQLRLSEPSAQPNWGWFINRHRGLGHTCMVFRRAQLDSPASQRAPLSSARDALPYWSSIPSRGMKVDDHAFGLPFRCLRAVQHAPQDTSDYRVLKGWTANMGEIWLPRRVLWTAILANTLLLAAAWWAALVLPGMSRCVLRRRRGLCPACAYDLRATPAGNPCPECGLMMHGR